jgi:hypothetical protein
MQDVRQLVHVLVEVEVRDQRAAHRGVNRDGLGLVLIRRLYLVPAQEGVACRVVPQELGVRPDEDRQLRRQRIELVARHGVLFEILDADARASSAQFDPSPLLGQRMGHLLLDDQLDALGDLIVRLARHRKHLADCFRLIGVPLRPAVHQAIVQVRVRVDEPRGHQIALQVHLPGVRTRHPQHFRVAPHELNLLSPKGNRFRRASHTVAGGRIAHGHNLSVVVNHVRIGHQLDGHLHRLLRPQSGRENHSRQKTSLNQSP